MLDRPENPAALEIAVDIGHPSTYLAFQPTLALIDEMGIRAEWVPIIAPPFHKPLIQGDDRGNQHRRLRAEYERRDIRRYASALGLTLDNLERNVDSRLAARGLMTAMRQSGERAYLGRVLAGHWSEGVNIEDPKAIEDILRQIGVSGELVDESEFSALQQATAARGIFASPTYLIDSEPFLGRAHLPMIRWILSGRQGTPPI